MLDTHQTKTSPSQIGRKHTTPSIRDEMFMSEEAMALIHETVAVVGYPVRGLSHSGHSQ